LTGLEKKVGGAAFLAQGTLYPDVIESVSSTGGPSVTIKSHHNVGGLPERMNMKLIEPLRELFKDEVRALGREFGLPEHFVGRHPFAGPGLAIRAPGAITRDKLDILRKADVIYLDEPGCPRHGAPVAERLAFHITQFIHAFICGRVRRIPPAFTSFSRSRRASSCS